MIDNDRLCVIMIDHNQSYRCKVRDMLSQAMKELSRFDTFIVRTKLAEWNGKVRLDFILQSCSTEIEDEV